MALTNAEHQRNWRRGRAKYIKELEDEVAKLKNELRRRDEEELRALRAFKRRAEED
jgi:hypothetical protein